MKRLLQLLGNRIRSLREERELSRAEVASALGLGVDTLMRIELGYKPTSFESLDSLSHVLRVDPAFLFVFPELNYQHATLELMRKAPRAKLEEMYAACEAILASGKRTTKPVANRNT